MGNTIHRSPEVCMQQAHRYFSLLQRQDTVFTEDLIFPTFGDLGWRALHAYMQAVTNYRCLYCCQNDEMQEMQEKG